MKNNITYNISYSTSKTLSVYNCYVTIIYPKTKTDGFFRQEGRQEYKWFKTIEEAEDFIIMEKLSQ